MASSRWDRMPGTDARRPSTNSCHPMKRFGLTALAAMTLVAATPAAQSTDAEHYLDQFIDKTANPRNDFWQYSVGKWLKEHPIPKSERSWGVGNVIQEETYQRLSD